MFAYKEVKADIGVTKPGEKLTVWGLTLPA